MTSLFQAVSRHVAFTHFPRAASRPRMLDTAQKDAFEYQLVFAVTAGLLAGGVAIVLGALHTL